MNIKELKGRYAKIEDDADDMALSDLEDQVYQLEEDVDEAIHFGYDEEEEALLRLKQKIARFKKENDFYDAEAELDMMFPDRHDDDFDEESMSIF